MLLVLLPPGVQLSLHGVHVLLDVVHGLPQRQGAATNQLDGRAKPLGLPAHHLPLFFLCRFGQQELKSEGWETNMSKLNLQPTNKMPLSYGFTDSLYLERACEADLHVLTFQS